MGKSARRGCFGNGGVEVTSTDKSKENYSR